jgi:hypothetical protein
MATQNVDIEMPEQTSKNVTIITEIDLTGSDVVWVASFNGVQKIKKDTGTMLIMIDTAPSTTVANGVSGGASTIQLVQVTDFPPRPNDGKPTADFAPGDNVTITAAGSHEETNVIQSIDGTTITLATPLKYAYSEGDTFVRWITSFTFQLLPGDTMLPGTKTYGTPIIWQHMALVTYPGNMSPENMKSAPTALVPIMGRMFISPILDMS